MIQGRDDFRKQWSGERGGGNCDDEGVENGAAHVSVVRIHRKQRCGMRGHKAVIDRKSGDQRQGDADQRGSGAASDREGDGNEQHESDFEESGKANDETDAHHGPGNALFAEDANQCERDRVGSAGLGHHFAEHGAERNHDGDVAKCSANARFK